MSTLSQRNFAGGELSPALYAKCDFVKYMTGLRTCRRAFVQKDGGVSNDAGSEFIAEVKDSTKTGRLFSFVSGSTVYLLEFSDSALRFYKAGVPVREAAKVITGITKANPGVVTSAAHGFTAGDHVYLSGIVGMTELNGRTLRVGTTAANTFQLLNLDGTNFNTTSLTAYSSAGTASRVYTLATIWAEADLPYLKFAYDGSANALIIAKSGSLTKKLVTAGDTSWTLTSLAFDTSPSTLATPVGLAASGSAGAYVAQSWCVTAVNDATGEESLASNVATSSALVRASTAAPVTVTWTTQPDATSYRVYKALKSGAFGLLGIAASGASPTFIDEGQTVDFTQGPPPRSVVTGLTFGLYWNAVAYFQRRLTLGGNLGPSSLLVASMSGVSQNFLISDPIFDTDAYSLYLSSGVYQHIIYSILDIGKLMVFTSQGEWIIQGNDSGIVIPAAINPTEYSSYGSGILSPLKIGNKNALFVQACGNVVRDLGFDINVDGYKGNDLTEFAFHLFKNNTISGWTYQRTPHSIVWAIRNDGVMLGLTYIKEQEITGWHRHDTLGNYEDAFSFPRLGQEDDVYHIVKRTINGATKRYIERKKSRNFSDIKDAVFMDCSATYDGRNTGATTMTLSGGTTWASDETITITASAATFTSASVGNQIQLTGSDGTLVTFTLNAYTSTTVMTGKPDKTVPVAMRSVAITNWALAIKTVTGLWHLEGQEVSVFGDGYVVASPYNPDYAVVTVASGQITLAACYGVIHVGMPYISDVETLNIDTANAETMSDKGMIVKHVHCQVEQTRGLFVGPKPPTDDDVDPLENLRAVTQRSSDGGYDVPLSLDTESFEVSIPGEWNSNGRIFIRQVDPLPFSILSIKPQGDFPIGR
jgi:hypothetical protein